MKQIVFIFAFFAAFFLVLRPVKCQTPNILYGTGIGYTNGAPNFTPSYKGGRIVVDTVTNYWYEYATPGGWRLMGDRIQTISGCSAPMYTPGKGQSSIVLNGCDSLYSFRSGLWRHLNGGGAAVDSSLYVTVSRLADSTAAIRADFPSGVSWPLLAPNGSITAPSYSFSGSTRSGIWMTNKIFKITADEEKSIDIIAGDNNSGGNAGAVQILAGDAPGGTGGDFQFIAGDGSAGGSFSLAAGSGSIGGSFSLTAGGSTTGNGAALNITAGLTTDNADGGKVTISAGASAGRGGNVDITAGSGNKSWDRGKIVITSNGVVLPKLSSSEISALIGVESGTILYCTNCTAIDGSTGVTQTYNGSIWKKHW